MRYLGNKESILTEISDLLLSKGLLKEGYVSIEYSTCGKNFSEQYSIDINYIHKVLTLEPQKKMSCQH